MKVLIVEDERKLAALLKKGLEENDFAVDLAFDGSEGLHMAENYSYDAVLLDLMLPETDGLTVLRKLREGQNDVPVLIVTARGEISDKIEGLNIGADDYIAKPFDLAEVIARLRAAIRRNKGKPVPVVAIGDLAVDTNARIVTRAGLPLSLSAREYALLEYLALNAGRVVTKTELVDHIYDTNYEWDSNVIEVHINHLRNKIEKDGGKRLIHTVRGAGYVVREDA